MTDLQRGDAVFKKLWEWTKRLYPTTFLYSYDEFKALYGTKINIYLDGIGFGVNSVSMSESRIDTAMKNLAQASGGKAPKNPLKIFDFLQNEAVKIDWLDAAVYVTAETAKDIGSGVAEIGDSLLTAGKVLNFLLPALVVIGVLWWVNDKTNNSLVRTAGAIKGMRK